VSNGRREKEEGEEGGKEKGREKEGK